MILFCRTNTAPIGTSPFLSAFLASVSACAMNPSWSSGPDLEARGRRSIHLVGIKRVKVAGLLLRQVLRLKNRAAAVFVQVVNINGPGDQVIAKPKPDPLVASPNAFRVPF